jgi:energy-coupling factor transporter ATP-binding protein EcfA2
VKEKIAIIGHVGAGKQLLTSAINDVIIVEDKKKTVNEILEEQRLIPFTIQQTPPLINTPIKSGKESRRERRAKQRKSKQ